MVSLDIYAPRRAQRKEIENCVLVCFQWEDRKGKSGSSYLGAAEAAERAVLPRPTSIYSGVDVYPPIVGYACLTSPTGVYNGFSVYPPSRVCMFTKSYWCLQ